VFADLDGVGGLGAGEPFAQPSAPHPLLGGGGRYLIEVLRAGPVDIRLVTPDPVSSVVVFPAGGSYPGELADGVVVTGLDFHLDLIRAPAAVEGTVQFMSAPLAGVTVFADLDGDGVFGSGEPSDVTSDPIPAVPLSGGDYRIEGIPSGAVAIRMISPDPENVVVVVPTDGFYSVVVSDGEVLTGLDFHLDLIAAGLCGDGTTDPDEQCDDGNGVNGDGCNTLCFAEYVDVNGGGSFASGFPIGGAIEFDFQTEGSTDLVAEITDGAGGCPGDTVLGLWRIGGPGVFLQPLGNDDDGGIGSCSRMAVTVGPGSYAFVVTTLVDDDLSTFVFTFSQSPGP
jgi:cysteine-rich repeat protein